MDAHSEAPAGKPKARKLMYEHLVGMNRRESPPAALTAKQEEFISGYSYFSDIRPPSYLGKVKMLGIRANAGYAALLPVFSLLALLAWTGKPINEVVPYGKWIFIIMLCGTAIAMFRFLGWVGGRIRRRRWESWEWPSFEAFAMEEADAQALGMANFAMYFILAISFTGYIVR